MIENSNKSKKIMQIYRLVKVKLKMKVKMKN
jgi:hypothetical protein